MSAHGAIRVTIVWETPDPGRDMGVGKFLPLLRKAVAAAPHRPELELQLARARLNGLRAGTGHAIALYPNAPAVLKSLSQLGPDASRF